ncbi:MAG: ATPase AAA [Herpetosiphonaceae bacterium]|nr:MAG: ATPase AAA [Herpetosiphonaceae bacterium]
MRFLIDQQSYDELMSRTDHPKDCYVRPGEYLHHMYVDGIKYVVAPALTAAIKEARGAGDREALQHLRMHEEELRQLVEQYRASGKSLAGVRVLGEVPPDDSDAPSMPSNSFRPPEPQTIADTKLNRSFLVETVARTLYAKNRMTGGELSEFLGLNYAIVAEILADLRAGEYADMVGQKGFGDIAYEYMLTLKGNQFAADAMQKTQYVGVCPVTLEDYVTSVKAQTIRNVVVTRRNIQQAFSDLIVSEAVLNEVGPAVNSGSSVFLFGFPGNGKTSIAERITRLMGDDIYVPHAVEADGQIVKVFDPIVHEQRTEGPHVFGSTGVDRRWARIKRPVVVVGGELTLEMLDLIYNETARFYEAPFQMKANGGIFLIDDFGRQQCRPQDLLNRWIVPLEKRFDYLTTVTGKKIEIPFDQLILFSTNLDPYDLADEAFLRRIKYKIQVLDPSEEHWRKIWKLVCKSRKVEYSDKGLDYMLEKWFKPYNRNLRMCHPRDILDQMISIAKYNMEPVRFDPDLIDAACSTYFVTSPKQSFR